jgi:polar amino acid transport system permease protein
MPETSRSVTRPALFEGGGRRARLLAAALLIAFVVAGCQASSYQYRWDFFFQSILQPDSLIIRGISLTLYISVIAQIIGVVLGVFGAVGKMGKARVPRYIAGVYVWVFRGTPLLVQIALIYFGLGVTRIYQWPDFTPLGDFGTGAVQAGIVALGVNEGAYMSEIVRAGILSIDPGQMEAAKSLGMTFAQAMRRIVLPQAARVIVPPLGNEFNNMLKTTSLLVVIGVPELYVTFSLKNAGGTTVFHPFELFLAAAVWYLVITTIWAVIQAQIERRLGAGFGDGGGGGPSLRERLFGLRAIKPDELPQISGGR